MSARVCVHESQSPLRPGRQPTLCGIWSFLRIDSRPAPATFPLADGMACLRLWMISKVKATSLFFMLVFFYSVAPQKNQSSLWLIDHCLPPKATVFLSDTNMQNPVLITCDKPVALATFIYSLIWYSTAKSETLVKKKLGLRLAQLPVWVQGQLANRGVLRSLWMIESTSRVSGKQSHGNEKSQNCIFYKAKQWRFGNKFVLRHNFVTNPPKSATFIQQKRINQKNVLAGFW